MTGMLVGKLELNHFKENNLDIAQGQTKAWENPSHNPERNLEGTNIGFPSCVIEVPVQLCQL